MDNSMLQTPVGLQYNSAAILSRQFSELFTLDSAVTAGTIVKQSTFQIDPRCPFFYIFAMGGQADASTGAAFTTKHSFSNGGTSLTDVTTAWGNQATLNAGPETFISILTTPNDGIGYIHDPVSGTCSAVNPGTLDQEGFIKRWTALADTLTVITTLYADFDFTETPGQYAHGVLQQPW